MLGIGLFGSWSKHDLIDLDVSLSMIWEMDWWIDDDLGYVFLDVFGHFGPFEVSFFFCVAVDAVEPRWANVCPISRSTTKNMETNVEMLEGSQGDLFDDAGAGLNEFRIPPIQSYTYVYLYVLIFLHILRFSNLVFFRLQLGIVCFFQHFSPVTWSFCPFPWIFPDAWHWTPAWQVLLRILAHVSCT